MATPTGHGGIRRHRAGERGVGEGRVRGRDANSYANVAWIFGQRNRPWGERPIFGKVRYMNARGLERKTDIRAYVEKVAALSDAG